MNWWLCSGYNTQQFRNVHNNGTANNNNASNTNNYQRPAMTKLFEAVMGGDPLIKEFNAFPRWKEGYRGLELPRDL